MTERDQTETPSDIRMEREVFAGIRRQGEAARELNNPKSFRLSRKASQPHSPTRPPKSKK